MAGLNLLAQLVNTPFYWTYLMSHSPFYPSFIYIMQWVQGVNVVLPKPQILGFTQKIKVSSAYRKPAFQPSAFRRLFIGFQPSAENQPISTWKFYKCFFKSRGKILVFKKCWISWVFWFYFMFQDISSKNFFFRLIEKFWNRLIFSWWLKADKKPSESWRLKSRLSVSASCLAENCWSLEYF